MRSSAEEADRLGRLAEDLLLIARSDQGKLPLRPERLAVPELFASVVNRFSWRAQEAERPLVAEAPRKLRLVGDRLRLEQALGNLVDNALRYGAGAVTLTGVSADGSVELHVTDEGEGFPAGFLVRAFERFGRPDEARGRAGAGLGLSIVAAIAQAHDGSAHAANGEEAGADVWLTLPGEQG